jgi:hypothetical protein
MVIDPMLVAGVILLLSGWLAVPLTIRFAGLATGLLGGVLALDACVLLFPDLRVPDWAYLLSAAIFGLLGMVVARGLWGLTLFLAGFFCALSLKMRLDLHLDLSEMLSQGALGGFALSSWWTFACGLVGGAALCLLQRYVVIVLASLSGAALIVRGTQLDEKWLALALVGMAFQTLCTVLWSGRSKRKERVENE